MKIKVLSFNREKNYHIVEVPNDENSYRNKVDFFVGCGLDLVQDATPEQYDDACLSIVGNEYEMSKDCWSEQHQMYLPNEVDLKSDNLIKE